MYDSSPLIKSLLGGRFEYDWPVVYALRSCLLERNRKQRAKEKREMKKLARQSERRQRVTQSPPGLSDDAEDEN